MDMQAVLELTNRQIWGNTIRAYLISAAIFLVVLAVLPLVKRFALKYLKILARRTNNEFDDVLHDLIRRIVGPATYLFTALYFATLALALPENLSRLLRALFIIVVTVKAAQVIQGVATESIRRWSDWTAREDPTAAAMLKNIGWAATFLIWTATVLFVLSNLGINVTAGLAGLGIGGVAVALAAQAILGDVFSSFAIFTDKPFNVGDFIIVGDLLGTVEHVGFKTTRIRSLGGEELIFANSDLTSSRIKNYKRMRERRVVFSAGVTYQTPVEKVKEIPATMKRIVEEHGHARFDRAHFQTFGDFALVYEVVYYVLSPDYNVYMDLQQSITLPLMEEFEKAGIEFAYPTQQLFVTRTDPVAGPGALE